MEVRVEELALRRDAHQSLGLEDVLKLARDELQALGPGIPGRAVRERPLQVIQYRQNLAEDIALHGEARHLLVALDAVAVVDELRLGTLPAVEVFGGSDAGGLQVFL